jgi:acyl-CoA synthetase (AMP-forming)/AMP-acid ligase II
VAEDQWIEFAVAYCGVQKTGAAVVPISPKATPPEIEYVLSASGAARVVDATAAPGRADTRWVAFGDLDPGSGPGDERPPAVHIGPGDLAQILYTSGTGGRPKGVGATHENLTFGCHLAPQRRDFDHSDVFLHAFPIGTTASQLMLHNTLVAHPSALVLNRFQPDPFCAAIAEHGVGTVFVVPAMAVDLVASRAFERHDLTGVVMVSSSGSTLPPPVARSLTEMFPNASVINCYTSTEALPAQVLMVVDPDRPASVGLILGPFQVEIRASDGAPRPTGETGDVWLRSPTTSRRYVDDPTADASTFRDGWVRMGDVGRIDDDGHLYLVDRESDLIQSGAMRISTTEIEAVIAEHPAVREVAVLGLPHPVMGTTVAAVVVAGDPAPSLRELRQFARERLALHKVPVRWLLTDHLPRNQMGKVLKVRLRERFTAVEPGTDGDGGAAPVRPGRENTLPSAQQDIFWAWMRQSSPVRHPAPIFTAIEVTEDLDIAALDAALAAVVRRHDALRTVFDLRDDRLRPVVLDELAVPVTRLGTATGPGQNLDQVRELVRRERDRPFDLAAGPLIRATVVTLDGVHHVVALTVHHLVFDAWSMGVLIRELAIAYAAIRHGRPVRFPVAAPLQPGRLVRESRQRWPGNRHRWLDLVAGARDGLGPFPGREPTDVLTPEAFTFAFDDGLSNRIRATATAYRATPFIVTLAAWASVLASWSGQTDLLMTSPVSGRTASLSDSAMGCLFTPLLLRLDLSDAGDSGLRRGRVPGPLPACALRRLSQLDGSGALPRAPVARIADAAPARRRSGSSRPRRRRAPADARRRRCGPYHRTPRVQRLRVQPVDDRGAGRGPPALHQARSRSVTGARSGEATWTPKRNVAKIGPR